MPPRSEDEGKRIEQMESFIIYSSIYFKRHEAPTPIQVLLDSADYQPNASPEDFNTEATKHRVPSANKERQHSLPIRKQALAKSETKIPCAIHHLLTKHDPPLLSPGTSPQQFNIHHLKTPTITKPLSRESPIHNGDKVKAVH